MIFKTFKALRQQAEPVIKKGEIFSGELAVHYVIRRVGTRFSLQLALLWDLPEGDAAKAQAFVSNEHPLELSVLQGGFELVFASALFKLCIDMYKGLEGMESIDASCHMAAQEGTLLQLVTQAATMPSGAVCIVLTPISITARAVDDNVLVNMKLEAGPLIIISEGTDMTFREALNVAFAEAARSAMPLGTFVDADPASDSPGQLPPRS